MNPFASALLGPVLEAMDHDVLVVDATGAVVTCNARFLAAHGFRSLAECPPHREGFADLQEVFTPQGQPIGVDDLPLARALRGETCRDVEVRIRRLRLGHWSQRRLTAVPVRSGTHEVIGAVLLAREVAAARYDILHDVLHRTTRQDERNALRNAVQVVLAAPEVLASDPLSARQGAMLERLQRAGQTLARLLGGRAAPPPDM